MKKLLIATLLILVLTISPTFALATPAYQECIPNGEGSVTSLTASYGLPNWFCVTRPGGEVRMLVYEGGDETEIPVPGRWIDEDGNLVFDTSSPNLSWPFSGIYTIPEGEFVLDPEVFDCGPAGCMYLPRYATFNVWVEGTGIDLYEVEDTPQAMVEEHGLFSVTQIVFIINATGRVKFTWDIDGTQYQSPSIEIDGYYEYPVEINPKTLNRFKFSEMDDMEVGMRLVNGTCDYLKARVDFQIP